MSSEQKDALYKEALNALMADRGREYWKRAELAVLREELGISEARHQSLLLKRRLAAKGKVGVDLQLAGGEGVRACVRNTGERALKKVQLQYALEGEDSLREHVTPPLGPGQAKNIKLELSPAECGERLLEVVLRIEDLKGNVRCYRTKARVKAQREVGRAPQRALVKYHVGAAVTRVAGQPQQRPGPKSRAAKVGSAVVAGGWISLTLEEITEKTWQKWPAQRKRNAQARAKRKRQSSAPAVAAPAATAPAVAARAAPAPAVAAPAAPAPAPSAMPAASTPSWRAPLEQAHGAGTFGRGAMQLAGGEGVRARVENTGTLALKNVELRYALQGDSYRKLEIGPLEPNKYKEIELELSLAEGGERLLEVVLRVEDVEGNWRHYETKVLVTTKPVAARRGVGRVPQRASVKYHVGAAAKPDAGQPQQRPNPRNRAVTVRSAVGARGWISLMLTEITEEEWRSWSELRKRNAGARAVGERQSEAPAVAARAAPAPAVAAPAMPVASTPSWRAGWMSNCGEDEFGRWAAVSIAGVEHRFRYCAPGTFKMGSPASEVGRFDDESPQHSVTLTRGFWLGEAPVTQRQWEAVAESNPSHRKGDDLPVERVSWNDCVAWMARARRSGLGLRFPTEAEWEYACRAGTTGATYRGGSDAATLDGIAWYSVNSGSKTHPVKQKAPNPWGLYDMLGNVSEWCADSKRTYSASAVVDPSGGLGAWRVYRGGSWGNDAQDARAAYRCSSTPDGRGDYLGFRLARGQ